MKKLFIITLICLASFAAGWACRGLGVIEVTTGTETLVHGLRRFYAFHGRYPTDSEGLYALYRISFLGGPFVRENGALLDVYGRLIIYDSIDGGYVLWSAGSDGVRNSRDDIELARIPFVIK